MWKQAWTLLFMLKLGKGSSPLALYVSMKIKASAQYGLWTTLITKTYPKLKTSEIFFIPRFCETQLSFENF